MRYCRDAGYEIAELETAAQAQEGCRSSRISFAGICNMLRDNVNPQTGSGKCK